MHYLKNKFFARWARKNGISDNLLNEAIAEFESGLFEASLGNHLYKKRIALAGKGKSGGTRTILFYQQDNLSHAEVKFLNKMSDSFQNLPEDEIIKNIKTKNFFIISYTEE